MAPDRGSPNVSSSPKIKYSTNPHNDTITEIAQSISHPASESRPSRSDSLTPLTRPSISVDLASDNEHEEIGQSSGIDLDVIELRSISSHNSGNGYKAKGKGKVKDDDDDMDAMKQSGIRGSGMNASINIGRPSPSDAAPFLHASEIPDLPSTQTMQSTSLSSQGSPIFPIYDSGPSDSTRRLQPTPKSPMKLPSKPNPQTRRSKRNREREQRERDRRRLRSGAVENADDDEYCCGGMLINPVTERPGRSTASYWAEMTVLLVMCQCCPSLNPNPEEYMTQTRKGWWDRGV